MLLSTSLKCPVLLIGFIFCLQFSSYSQLKADFTLDKPGGCAPFAVSFTNTTTGASASARYQWDFDNGNHSSLKNSGALFQQEKTYSVMLTVTDSGRTSTKTQTVTGYPKPSVDFSASVPKGCMPLPVTFAVEDPGSGGSISSYFWDFGDGVTESASGIVTHTYTAPRVPIVSLTVTNSNGCQSTLVKENTVAVLPALIAGFSVEEKVLCTLADAAKFKDSSKGPGNLSYRWDFGDGGTSNNPNPSHVFSTKGIYPIKLVVTSTEGCIAETSRGSYINAADFETAVEVLNLPVCLDNGVQLELKSKVAPDSITWDFGNGYTYSDFNGNNIGYHNYMIAGKYTVKVTGNYGSCKELVTKVIDVHAPPVLNGFLVKMGGVCGTPVEVTFSDTTNNAVKWEWYAAGYPTNFESTIKAPVYNFTIDDIYYVRLKVTNTSGCTAITGKTVDIRRPHVNIQSVDAAQSGEVLSCGPKPLHFNAVSSEPITSYLWDFADGYTSVEPAPVHIFEKAGHYRVSLKYTTANGCTGTVELRDYVVRRDRVKADFTTASNNICGNTPVTITNTSGASVYYNWDLGEGFFQANTGQYSQVVHQFQKKGTYTIRLIATDGVCADTMTKTDYIIVSPPFPKITGFQNTCDGLRGEVTFQHSSTEVISGTWDFGDGTPLVPYVDQPQMKHTYARTGWYKVILSTTNGQCTVKDSTYVTVLLKQYPVLTADKLVVCSLDEDLKLTISNLEKSPIASNYNGGYSPSGWYHNDGSFAPGDYVSMGENLGDTGFTMFIRSLTIGKQGLHCMVTSGLGCIDTTNSIPLTIKGPIPGFKVNNKPCSNGTVVFFQDTSRPQNGVALASWEWNFGDGPLQTYLKGGEFTHDYWYAQQYNVSVKVTDVSGCSSRYSAVVDALGGSLQSSFTASATTISPGTTVSFTNTSHTSDEVNTKYKWILSDGTVLTGFDAEKTFPTPGSYQVTLIATNIANGCSDTASSNILVKFVNAAFTIDNSFISTSKCPPVLVRLASTSSNVSRISWDFGDGTQVEDVYNPSHVYTKGGVYKIRVTTHSDNGTAYTTLDSVSIPEHSAKLEADFLQSCTAQLITLSAVTKNVSSYVWDFGDGSIVPSTDSFSTHLYQHAGIYSPRVLITDSLGCTSSVNLANKIIIDSLYLSLNDVPRQICTPKEIVFVPAIVNIAASQATQALVYHWDFGTGNGKDTSNVKTPSFVYRQPGVYPVTLKVSSQFGCKKEVTVHIRALEGLGGQVKGPTEICAETTALFTGATLIPGQPEWKWIFHDGTIVQQQNAPPKKYNEPGNFPVMLIIDNGGCVDTLTHLLQVREKPQIDLSLRQATVCEGSQVAITAVGGTTYAWSPTSGLDAVDRASVTAAPLINTIYTVIAKNTFGCSNTNSVSIVVVHPGKVSIAPAAMVCIGNSVRLEATGAASYQWIQNTTGLSNTAIPVPSASPVVTTLYTVVGTDADNCFSDTGRIRVVVQPLPVVDAGPAALINAGTEHLLQTASSNDVIKWSWSPAQSLSCSDCASPVAKPTEPVVYTATVSNAAGCTASDSVSISLLCSDSRIFIPAAFSPNNDGVNDRFVMRGEGVRLVNHLSIFNRYGKVIFERNNFPMGDRNASWDGRYKGEMVPVGVYVYIATLSCNEKIFTKKGTITVVY